MALVNGLHMGTHPRMQQSSPSDKWGDNPRRDELMRTLGIDRGTRADFRRPPLWLSVALPLSLYPSRQSYIFVTTYNLGGHMYNYKEELLLILFFTTETS
jgi:hypothetical protein